MKDIDIFIRDCNLGLLKEPNDINYVDRSMTKEDMAYYPK